VSYRQKGNGWVVEIYDPIKTRKRHVKPSDFGMDPPRTERHARALERAALNARDQSRLVEPKRRVRASRAAGPTTTPPAVARAPASTTASA
jgi:hypothetical protein